MPINYTIDVSDLADQDAVSRAILEIQNNDVSYSLVQNGVEVAKVIPAERQEKPVSAELTKKRWEAEARADALSERITRLWSTNETAVEAIQNDRR
ncbi:MAG: hypothetical protein FWE95_10325 [Planctomycetaceae bacterium]|nr:hypothetical protein [Planctomycetaceae bacterium]